MQEETPATMQEEPPMPDPTPASDPVALAKQVVESALADMERNVEAFIKFSTDDAKELAEDNFQTFREAIESPHLSQADKTAYEERYLNIKTDFDNRDELRISHIDKNNMNERWITAIDNWNKMIDERMDNGNDNIVLNLGEPSNYIEGTIGFRNPTINDVIDSRQTNASTGISAFRINGDEVASDLLLKSIRENLPNGWEGRSFELGQLGNSGRILKIFTNHENGSPYREFAGNWEDFWNTNNNSTTNTFGGIPATRANTLGTAPTGLEQNGPGISRYFEGGYHEYAFGESRVDILRGTRSEVDTVTNAERMEVIRIREGGSSAIHFTDLSIRGENLATGLNIGISTSNDLNTFDLNTFAEIFGQQVTLGCTVNGMDGAPVTANGGGCRVTLDPEGFLTVTHERLTDAGEAIATLDETGEAATITAINNNVDDDENIAHLTLTTTQTRAQLAPMEINIARPDSQYTVMGYWMDEHGDKYAIDTFATARYGPAEGMGIAEDMGRLMGEAEYSGSALGVYVMNKGDESNKDLYSGEFKAEVSLTADFGGQNFGSNDSPFTVGGTIQGFDSLTDDEHDLDNWTLTLDESSINNADGSFSGTTTGTGEGKWKGQFHGMDGLSTADVADDHPLAAVGDFSGDFGNSNRVVGVFSAEKMEE